LERSFVFVLPCPSLNAMHVICGWYDSYGGFDEVRSEVSALIFDLGKISTLWSSVSAVAHASLSSPLHKLQHLDTPPAVPLFPFQWKENSLASYPSFPPSCPAGSAPLL